MCMECMDAYRNCVTGRCQAAKAELFSRQYSNVRYECLTTVDLRLVEPEGRRSDLVGEEANPMDLPALGKGVLK
jgi:hypothetical protein